MENHHRSKLSDIRWHFKATRVYINGRNLEEGKQPSLLVVMPLNCFPGRSTAPAHGHQEATHPGYGAARAEGVHGAAHRHLGVTAPYINFQGFQKNKHASHPSYAEGLGVDVALARHAHRPRLRPRRHLRVARVAVKAVVGLAALAEAEAEGRPPEAEVYREELKECDS